MRRKYGDQEACEMCGLDIEWHGREHGRIDRGSNTHCDEGGAARYDQGGVLVPFPHRKHGPTPAWAR